MPLIRLTVPDHLPQPQVDSLAHVVHAALDRLDAQDASQA